MNEFIALAAIILVLIVGLFTSFEPRIEFIKTYNRITKIVIFYNSFKHDKIEREFIILYNRN